MLAEPPQRGARVLLVGGDDAAAAQLADLLRETTTVAAQLELEPDPVAALDPVMGKGGRKSVHLSGQLRIGQPPVGVHHRSLICKEAPSIFHNYCEVK